MKVLLKAGADKDAKSRPLRQRQDRLATLGAGSTGEWCNDKRSWTAGLPRLGLHVAPPCCAAGRCGSDQGAVGCGREHGGQRRGEHADAGVEGLGLSVAPHVEHAAGAQRGCSPLQNSGREVGGSAEGRCGVVFSEGRWDITELAAQGGK
eukprot:3938910-Rhodomonas_salina.10